MEKGKKVVSAGEMEFVENENGELTDLKLSDNEEEKADGEGSKDVEGGESVLDNAEVKKEMEEFLKEEKAPTESEKVAKSQETDAPVTVPPKNQSKEPKVKMYYDKALAVGGPPFSVLLSDTGTLKRKLVEELGIGSVKIKPRSKEERELYIYFASEELLEKGKKFLDGHNFSNYILKAKILSSADLKNKLDSKGSTGADNSLNNNLSSGPNKRKMEDNPDDEPEAKKERPNGEDIFYYEDYNEQVSQKNKGARKIVEDFGTNLKRVIPEHKILITNREKKNNGVLCKLDELHECAPAQRLFARCKFAIGIDDETGEIAVGFNVGGGKMKKNSKARQYFLPHILEAADVFEKLVKSSEREPGKGTSGFWRKLIVRCSTEGKIMLTVVVQAEQEKAQEELKYLKGLITDFYEKGEGKNTKVISVYSEVTYVKRSSGSDMALAWGEQYLEEKFRGMTLLLDAKTFFFFNVHAAGILIDTLMSLLKPTKKTTIIEMGCSTGMIGRYLAEYVNEIYCVGKKPGPAEVVLKRSPKCQYVSGNEAVVLRKLKITYPRSCVVISTSVQNSLSPRTVQVIRKMPEIKRLILITSAIRVCCSRTFITLMKPGEKEDLGNPFFPMRIAPVDTMPNGKHYIMVVLFERIGTELLSKSDSAEASAKTKFSPRRNMPKNMIGPDMNFRGVRNTWNERRAAPFENFADIPPLIQPPALNQPVIGRSTWIENQIPNPLDEPRMGYADILQRQEFINNEIAEEYRRRLLEEREAEAYRQRLLEEKEREAEQYRRRLLEEKEREAEEYRQRLLLEKEREAAEYQKKLQEERAAEEYKQMQLKERLRLLEEEEYRRRLLLEARERELRELNSKAALQNALTSSLRDAALTRLDNEAALKLKNVIAEAIRGAGIVNPEEQGETYRQDRKPDAQYSRYGSEQRDAGGNNRYYDESEKRNPWENRNLPFQDNIASSKAGLEREPMMGVRKPIDNRNARVPLERKDRDLPPKALDSRDMPFSGRRPSEAEMALKDKPVSLLSLKFPASIEANRSMPSSTSSLSQQVRRHDLELDERWRVQDNIMDRKRWSDGIGKSAAIPEPWRPGLLDARQAGRSNNDSYPREIRGKGQDEWRGYTNKGLLPEPREVYGRDSRLHVDRETGRSRETDYQRGSVGSTNSLIPSVYGHIYGRTKPELESFRKPY